MKVARICIAALFLPISFLSLNSCVNEEYDLSEDIDMEMTVLKNVSLPIGDVETITLNNLLTIDEDSEMINVSESGNYSLSFAGQAITTEVEIPYIFLDDFLSEESVVKFGTGSFAGLTTPPGVEGRKVAYSDLYGSVMEMDLDLEVVTVLPSQVKDIDLIRFVSNDNPVSIHMAVDDGAMHIAEGFTIVFPIEIELNDVDASCPYTVTEGYKVVFTEDVLITVDSPFALELGIAEFALPDNAVVTEGETRSIAYHETVSVSGDAYINTSDFDVVPENIDLVMTAQISDLEVSSVSVVLAMEAGFDDTEVAVGNVPDFLKGDDVCIDLYNPELFFAVDNGTPVSFSFEANVTAYSSAGTTSLKFGPWDVNHDESMSVLVTRREYEDPLPAEITTAIMPELGAFISNLPERILLHDVKLELDEEPVIVTPGTAFTATTSYSISAPLSFDKDLDLSFVTDIKNLGVDLGTDVRNVVLTLDMVNSVPVNFNIAAKATDAEGNVIDGITLTLDKAIAAGTQSSPTETSVRLSLDNRSGNLKFDGLRLEMTADTGDSPFNGTPLNRNQGLKIDNLVISLPDGITLNAE